MFIPINAGNLDQNPNHLNGKSNNIDDVSRQLVRRPQTAPVTNDIYRPSSALDIPELSKDSLRSMLK